VKTAFAIGCLAFTLTACATANTPQQNLAYDRWAKCNAPYAQLERVDLDGRITFLSSNSATREAVVHCLVEAGGAGPRLPDPVATRPAGGP
jgi:hypothetical protein